MGTTPAERLRDGLRAARLVHQVELSQPRHLRFRPSEGSCTYCGWPNSPDLGHEEGIGFTCVDMDACLSRHDDCSDAPHLGWLEPLREQADEAELALSRLGDLVLLRLSAEQEDADDQVQPDVPHPLPGGVLAHMISGRPEHHRAGMLGTTRHTLDLAGHPDNRRLMGYGRHIRGGPPDVENQGGVPDQDQALPEETRQRQRQAKAKGLTSPRATAKRAAQRRKAASKGRR